MQEITSELVKSLQEKIERLSLNMEKMKLAEYVDLMNNPARLLFLNFIAGVVRGLGVAVGFTLLGALVLVILQRLVVLNLPLVSDFIAAIVRLVQIQLHGSI
ncbi:MAG: Putative membrane protein [Thermoanaerobacterales bacterium 50_218]|nr:MAG: Putative membrane protein [Thermoanaerobacterales bacterium 50_218]